MGGRRDGILCRVAHFALMAHMANYEMARGSASESSLHEMYEAATSNELRNAFTARSGRARVINKIHSGFFADIVTSALSRRYHPETFESMQMLHGIQTHNNIMNDVLDKISVEWGDGARYWLMQDSVEIESEPFKRITKNFDSMMRTVARMCRLHGNVFVIKKFLFNCPDSKFITGL